MNKKWVCNYCHKVTRVTKTNESYVHCPKCGMEGVEKMKTIIVLTDFKGYKIPQATSKFIAQLMKTKK